MSIHKIPPFLSDIKTFFKDSDITVAMQNIANIISVVKMTEHGTIGVVSKRNHVYRLLSVIQCLLKLPLFGVRKISHVDGEDALACLFRERTALYNLSRKYFMVQKCISLIKR